MLLQIVCQNIKWPALAVGWQRAHADYRVRYLGDGTDSVIATSVHLQFRSGLRDRTPLAVILNPSMNIRKSLLGWELEKAYDLLERTWLKDDRHLRNRAAEKYQPVHCGTLPEG
jgi:hypothetical protein